MVGCGKTYVACALGEQDCQQNTQVAYYRLTRLLDDLNIGHADGSYQKQLLQLSKKELLILDDWSLEKLNAQESSDLLEVIEDRYQPEKSDRNCRNTQLSHILNAPHQ
jgi:DNA replication protein DnaC